MSRLLWWSVENFMSIEKAKCEFDDRNIINLKGYNDSGKSAMALALKILMTNCNPTKQVDFIQDDKEYFRILAYFDDGVMILRDKYINGQSLYEMYKDNKVIYSSKQKNGALESIREVPEPIKLYLDLLIYDDMVLNARSCFEKQFGVQTTGGENYKAFNAVLKSEELTVASNLLNTDKNKLVAEINGVSNDLSATKNLVDSKAESLTKDLIDELKSQDLELDSEDSKLAYLDKIRSLDSSIAGIKIFPEVESISYDSLNSLISINKLYSDLGNLVINPETRGIDTSQLSNLSHILDILNELNSVGTILDNEVPSVSNKQLSELGNLLSLSSQLSKASCVIQDIDMKLAQNNEVIKSLETELSSLGRNYIKCPSCGVLFEPNTEHIH